MRIFSGFETAFVIPDTRCARQNNKVFYFLLATQSNENMSFETGQLFTNIVSMPLRKQISLFPDKKAKASLNTKNLIKLSFHICPRHPGLPAVLLKKLLERTDTLLEMEEYSCPLFPEYSIENELSGQTKHLFHFQMEKSTKKVFLCALFLPPSLPDSTMVLALKKM